MMDFFLKALSETAETKLSDTFEMPKFFMDLQESQENTDTPVATVEMPNSSDEDLSSNPFAQTEATESVETNEEVLLSPENHSAEDSGPKHDNINDGSEIKSPIQNKIDGLAREKEVAEELREKYPPEEEYEIVSEAYLRDKNGNIARDPETEEGRRIDFVIVKDGIVVDSIEVTSKTADKTEQSAKEDRIRDVGGNYIRDSYGNLVEIPPTVQTRIERRD